MNWHRDVARRRAHRKRIGDDDAMVPITDLSCAQCRHVDLGTREMRLRHQVQDVHGAIARKPACAAG